MEKLYDILPYKTAKMIVDYFSNAPISFTNVGALDQSRLALGKAQVAEAFMTGSIKYAPYFQVAVSTFDDLPTLSVNLYGTQSDRKNFSFSGKYCAGIGISSILKIISVKQWHHFFECDGAGPPCSCTNLNGRREYYGDCT